MGCDAESLTRLGIVVTDEELQNLWVVVGSKRVCGHGHIAVTDDAFCIKCGSRVRDDEEIVPGIQLQTAAAAAGISPEEYFDNLVGDHVAWTMGVYCCEDRTGEKMIYVDVADSDTGPVSLDAIDTARTELMELAALLGIARKEVKLYSQCYRVI